MERLGLEKTRGWGICTREWQAQQLRGKRKGNYEYCKINGVLEDRRDSNRKRWRDKDQNINSF